MKYLLLMFFLVAPVMADDGVTGYIDLASSKTTKWNAIYNYINTHVPGLNPGWQNSIRQINYAVSASTPVAFRRISFSVVISSYETLEAYVPTVQADPDVIKMDVTAYSYGHDAHIPCIIKARWTK